MRCHVFTFLRCLFSNISMVKKYFCFCSLSEHFALGYLLFQNMICFQTKLSLKTNIEKKHHSKYSVVVELRTLMLQSEHIKQCPYMWLPVFFVMKIYRCKYESLSLQHSALKLQQSVIEEVF